MTNYSFGYLYRDNRNFNKHDAYIKLFALTAPIIPTWLILNFTRWSANVVTVLGFLFGMTGVVWGYFYGLEYLLYGFIIFLILDFVDGNVAIARGGGTFLGAILDMASDRAILFASVYTLIHYHLGKLQLEEIGLLLAYFMFFIFLDVLQLAFYKGQTGNSNADSKKEDSPKGSNDFRKIFSDPIIWIPGRLSSYLFIIGVYLTSGSLAWSYVAGIICVAGEYLTMILRHGKSLSD